MSKHGIEDARRCLQCRTPICSPGCPVRTPIRDAIRLLPDSEIAKAGRLLFESSPLSLACCRVCPRENQCEGHCVLGKKGSPVQIGAIERCISPFPEHLPAACVDARARAHRDHRLRARGHPEHDDWREPDGRRPDARSKARRRCCRSTPRSSRSGRGRARSSFRRPAA